MDKKFLNYIRNDSCKKKKKNWPSTILKKGTVKFKLHKKLLNKIWTIKAWQQVLLSHLYHYHQTLQCTKCQIAHEVKSINCQ